MESYRTDLVLHEKDEFFRRSNEEKNGKLIQPLPDYHLTQIEYLPKLEPNVNTIDNIISLLGKSENLTLSSNEISDLKSQSKSALKKLQECQYDDNLSLLEFLNSRCEFGDSFSIGGKVIHAAGMIELLYQLFC